MVYNTQNYWVFELCPLPGNVITREHNVSETGYVSVLSWGETTLLGLLEKANLMNSINNTHDAHATKKMQRE
jgi:hypothetical protein